jgi:hypothetical protein
MILPFLPDRGLFAERRALRLFGHDVSQSRPCERLLERFEGLIQPAVQRTKLKAVDSERAGSDPQNRLHSVHNLDQPNFRRSPRKREATPRASLSMDKTRASESPHHLGQVCGRNSGFLNQFAAGLQAFRAAGEADHRPQCVLDRLSEHPISREKRGRWPPHIIAAWQDESRQKLQLVSLHVLVIFSQKDDI